MSMFYYRKRMAQIDAASLEAASQNYMVVDANAEDHIVIYTKNQINRLKAAEAKELAAKLGIDFAEDAPGTQVKALIIEALKL